MLNFRLTDLTTTLIALLPANIDSQNPDDRGKLVIELSNVVNPPSLKPQSGWDLNIGTCDDATCANPTDKDSVEPFEETEGLIMITPGVGSGHALISYTNN